MFLLFSWPASARAWFNNWQRWLGSPAVDPIGWSFPVVEGYRQMIHTITFLASAISHTVSSSSFPDGFVKQTIWAVRLVQISHNETTLERCLKMTWSHYNFLTEADILSTLCVHVRVCVCVCRGNSPLHYPWSVYNKLRDPEQTSSCHLLSSTKQALKHTHPATLKKNWSHRVNSLLLQ